MLELANCEATLLHEIENRRMKRADIALTYRLTLQSSEWKDVDWAKVNRAIIGRWSLSSLNWIKRNAWTAFGVPVGAIEQGGRG